MSRGGIFASAAVDDSLPALIIEKACNLSVTNNVISALSEISSYLSQWQWHTYWHRNFIQKVRYKKDDFWRSNPAVKGLNHIWHPYSSGYWKRLCVEWRVCLACLHFSKFSKIAFARSSALAAGPATNTTGRVFTVDFLILESDLKIKVFAEFILE